MKALSLLLFTLVFIAVINVSWQKETLTDDKDICRLFKDGVKLRKPGTCNEGIICEGFKSKPLLTCTDTLKWYDYSNSKCVSNRPTDSYCATPCKKTTSTRFISDPKNCNNWFQCNGATEVSSGSCPTNMLFNAKMQQCTYSDLTSCTATYDFCNVVPKNIQFSDENNCHKYYQCSRTTNKLQNLECDVGKYFDAKEGKCMEKAQVNCYKHPYPTNVCGDTKIAKRNKFVSDEATCRGYFYCKDLGVGNPDKAPSWGQCSPFEFFNSVEEACQARTHVQCNEDRCDGLYEGQRELSGRKGCQHYLVCGNGYTKSEETCGDGLYFNAETKQCSPQKILYPACA